MLMALDQFVFGLSTAAYTDLQRQTAWKHKSTSRIGARDARQFVGPGDETITLKGLIAPELTGTLASLDELRAMGDTGDAYVMVDGTGKIYGAFVIESLSEDQSFHDQRGTPRRVEFSLSLTRVDDTLATSYREGA